MAELTLGFWRYLAASRYLTALWTPALYAAFPNGPADKRQAQRQVDQHLKNLASGPQPGGASRADPSTRFGP